MLAVQVMPGESVRIGDAVMRVLSCDDAAAQVTIRIGGCEREFEIRTGGSIRVVGADVRYLPKWRRGCGEFGVTAPTAVKVLRCELGEWDAARQPRGLSTEAV